MSVYLKQRYVCDVCGIERETLEQYVPAGCVPQVIASHNRMAQGSTLMDVCNACWPDLVTAFHALRPNKTWSPFNLGPAGVLPTGEKMGGSREADRHWRCNEAPVCIVQETSPGKDGLVGSMSLCGGCFVEACIQLGDGVKLVEKLIEEPTS